MRIVLVAIFVVLVFMLGLGMVQHRFFKGGRVERYQTVGP